MARTRPLTPHTDESTVLGAKAAAGTAPIPTTSVATTAMIVAILTGVPRSAAWLRRLKLIMVCPPGRPHNTPGGNLPQQAAGRQEPGTVGSNA